MYPGQASFQGQPIAQPMQTQPSPMPDLPPGWIAQFDPKFQRYYFVNTANGSSTWDDPRQMFRPPPGPPPPMYSNTPPASAPPSPEKSSDLASFYGLNQAPQPAPALQSAQNMPQFQVGSSLNGGQHTIAPQVGSVGVVDPTVAIALELSQSIPSLMKAPPAGSAPQVQDAWRMYLRRIQDAQNEHTRAIRDAQVHHDREIREAELSNKQQNVNMLSGGGFNVLRSFSSLMSMGTSQYNRQKDYKHRLDCAKEQYNRTVEHAHQRLNDQVEQANRDYEDAIRHSL